MDGGMLAHQGYEIMCETIEEQKKQLVAIEIWVTTKNRLIVEARSDTINHAYSCILNVW